MEQSLLRGGQVVSEKYILNIGSAYNIDTNVVDSPIKLEITREQLFLIEWFANIEIDEKLNKIYTLNKCRFTVTPKF